MITSGLLYIVYAFLFLICAPILALGDVTIDSNVGSAISSFGGFLGSINPIFPVNSLLAVLSAVLLLEAGIFTFKSIKFIYKKIPGVS